MKRALLAACVLVTACDHPPLSLRFRLTTGDSQQCYGDTGTPTTSCQDVTMGCDAYLSVRILSPDDPDAPYISVCKPLSGAQSKLCAIAGIDLPQPTMPVPEQVLEVQMAIFPKTAIGMDPDTGEAVCPRVRYGANGLPVPVKPICDDPDPFACPQVPAVGGRTYYRPGDDKTVVDLGCTQLEQITNMCDGAHRVSVSATVNDFDNVVSSVDKIVADRLSISVGEPQPLDATYVLNSIDSSDLARTTASVPSWTGLIDVDKPVTNTACLEVLDVGGAETTTALTCQAVKPGVDFTIPGIYLKKATLTAILGALGLTSFPDVGGLVVGLVLDKNLKPMANIEVTPSCTGCTIDYVSSDLSGIIAGGTSDNGIFVSLDTPYGTTFSIPSTVLSPVLGGIVEGKVTVVIIQDKETVVGGG